MALYRELNGALKWEGSRMLLSGQPKQVAMALRDNLRNMVGTIGSRAPELTSAVESFNLSNQQHAAAFDAQHAFMRLRGAKQTYVGPAGAKERVSITPERLAKSAVDEGWDAAKARQEFDARNVDMLTKTGVKPDSVPRLDDLASDYHTSLVNEKLSKILAPGRPIDESVFRELDNLREEVSKPAHIQAVENATNVIQAAFNNTKLNPKVAVRTLFQGGEDYSGQNVDTFNREVKPLLDKMPLEQQTGVWNGVLKHRLAKAGAGDRVLTPTDVEDIFRDPIISQAPASFREALRVLTERKLPDIIEGRIPEFAEPKPEKVSVDTARLPLVYGKEEGNVPPSPMKKTPMGEVILYLKNLSSIDDLSPLFMNAAIAGSERVGPRFLASMRSFIGKQGWEDLRTAWLARQAVGSNGRFSPTKLEAAITDSRIPQNVRDNLLFKSNDEYQNALETLRGVEIPIEESTKMVETTPVETGFIPHRRIAALVQFFKSNIAGVGGGYLLGGTGGSAVGLAGGLYLGYLQPRTAVRELVGSPTRFRRAMDMIRQVNDLSASGIARIGTPLPAELGMKERRIRRQRQ